VEEVPAERVLRRERDRVQDPVDLSPPGLELLPDGVDLGLVVGIHLQDVARVRQPLRHLLGEAHGASEVRQDDLSAVLLRGRRRCEGDRLRGQHAGDQQLLAVEQHGRAA
jgi:hypothetical protein